MQDTEEAVLLPAQVRAARALVAWTQDRLAGAARVGNSTVRDFEAGRRAPRRAQLAAIRAALEDAGVSFISDVGRIGVELHMLGTASASATVLSPPEGDGPSPAAGSEANPAFPEPQTAAGAGLDPLLDGAEALVRRMRREAGIREMPDVHRRKLLRALRLITEAADDCLDAVAGIRTKLVSSGLPRGGTSHRSEADRDAAGAAAPGWTLVDHVCLTCLSRILRRGDRFRCASCAAEATGSPDEICGCGFLQHVGKRPVSFRCVPNPDICPQMPGEIVIQAEAPPS